MPVSEKGDLSSIQNAVVVRLEIDLYPLFGGTWSMGVEINLGFGLKNLNLKLYLNFWDPFLLLNMYKKFFDIFQI